jgi:hypothetical protein
MIRPAFHCDDLVASLVGRMVGEPLIPPFTAIGVTDGEMLVGGVVFNGFTGHDIELTGAGHGCWTPRIIRVMARYVFHQLGCERCSMTIRASDSRTLSMARKIGFRIEGIHPKVFGDDAAISFGLLRSEQRLIRLGRQHEQPQSATYS